MFTEMKPLRPHSFSEEPIPTTKWLDSTTFASQASNPAHGAKQLPPQSQLDGLKTMSQEGIWTPPVAPSVPGWNSAEGSSNYGRSKRDTVALSRFAALCDACSDESDAESFDSDTEEASRVTVDDQLCDDSRCSSAEVQE